MLDRYFSPPSPGIRRKPQRPFGSAGQDRGFMPKPRNLPITTREPISDAKAREFLLPSSSWGSHRYGCSSYREEPWALGYMAYIGYSRGKSSKNGNLRVWLVTFWWRVRCWVLIRSHFPGWPRVLIGSQVVGWGQGISKGSFPGTLDSSLRVWSYLWLEIYHTHPWKEEETHKHAHIQTWLAQSPPSSFMPIKSSQCYTNLPTFRQAQALIPWKCCSMCCAHLEKKSLEGSPRKATSGNHVTSIQCFCVCLKKALFIQEF